MNNKGPYRTDLGTNKRNIILDAIKNTQEQKRSIVSNISLCSTNTCFGDLEMVDKLKQVYSIACNHERELIKQLTEGE